MATHNPARKTDRILLAILGVAFVAIVVLLPFHAFISTWGGTAIGPLLVWKSWKEIVLLALVPLVVWLCVLRPDIARSIWRLWLNRLVLAYVIVTLVMAIMSAAKPEAVLAGLLINLRFFAMFVLAEVLVFSGAPWVATLKKWAIAWLLGTAALLCVLSVLQVTLIPKDFLAQFGYNKDTTIAPYVLVDNDPAALRAFATMRGPNTLAAYLLLPLGLSLVLWWEKRRRWWALAEAAVIVVTLGLTGSRSAWLGAAAMLAILAFVTLPKEKLLRWLKWGTIPAIALIVVIVWLAMTVPQLRLAVFHSGYQSNVSLTQGSSDLHWQATLRGLTHALENPLGQGVGTSGPASFYATHPNIPEDYFVQIAEETGLFGLALFVAISVLLWRNLWPQRRSLWPRALLASLIGITIINIFLHGWADDPTAMTWWGLAGLFIASGKQK